MLAKKERYLQVFLLAIITATCIFVPFIIYNGGYFIYAGDFNAQQIPFYMHGAEQFREGMFYFDFLTDLGSNFIGTYAFYFVGSIFFLPALLFPVDIIPFIMAPLLILKFGVAALTSYAYITRFVKDSRTAVLGAMLYTFSGFSIYNVFFNNFLDIIALFPLLLLGLEMLIEEDRRGVFAFAVMLNAFNNYFFFIGQVVFVAIYFFVRLAVKRGVTFKKFLTIAFEAVIGFGMAMILFLPAVLAVTGNPRTETIMNGYDMFFYGNAQKYGAILHSLFFMPDTAYSLNFFPDSNVKWSSLSTFLPVFTVVGVFAFLDRFRKSFLSVLLKILAVMALVPFLNSFFFALNHSWYARWYYMPILIMALVTVIAFENFEAASFKRAFTKTALFVIFFSLIGIAPKYVDGELVFFQLADDPAKLWASISVSFLCLIFMAILIELRINGKKAYKRSIALVMVVSVVFATIHMGGSKMNKAGDDKYIEHTLNAEITFPVEDEFYRIDTIDTEVNLGLILRKPSIYSFNTVVPPSIMEFYPSVGVKRDVSSKPDPSIYPLRALLSVRYAVVGEDESYDVPGFVEIDKQGIYTIYENEYYLPMGFSYDYYITTGQYEDLAESARPHVLLKAIVLDGEQVEKYANYLEPLPDSAFSMTSEADYYADTLALGATATGTFTETQKGFTYDIVTDSDNLIFFSVPYDEGFTAYVNGVETDVEKVSSGMSAVFCPAGENTIVFEYLAPGLSIGMIVSAVSLGIFIIYIISVLILRRSKRARAK